MPLYSRPVTWLIFSKPGHLRKVPTIRINIVRVYSLRHPVSGFPISPTDLTPILPAYRMRVPALASHEEAFPAEPSVLPAPPRRKPRISNRMGRWRSNVHALPYLPEVSESRRPRARPSRGLYPDSPHPWACVYPTRCAGARLRLLASGLCPYPVLRVRGRESSVRGAGTSAPPA